MTNESADRLLAQIAWRDPATKKVALPRLRRELKEALAAERRATVERIRAALWATAPTEGRYHEHRPDMWISNVDEAAVRAILDAEAEQ